MADVWRTLGCRPSSSLRPPAGQAYRGSSSSGGGDGSSGSGSGDVGGDDVCGDDVGGGSGGGGGSGRGRTKVAGASRGALPGFTGVKGRDPLMTGSRPFLGAKCFLLTILW